MLLHQPRLQPQPRRHRRYLPCVVTLHATDGNQRRGVLGQRVRGQVFELPGFVPSVGEAGVEVVAFGVDGGFLAEVGGYSGERVDGGWAQGKGGSGDGGEGWWEGDVGHFALLFFLLCWYVVNGGVCSKVYIYIYIYIYMCVCVTVKL